MKIKKLKKVKIFLVLGLVGVLAFSSLLIWAGVSIARYATVQVNSVSVQSKIESIESGLKSLPRISTLSCWDKAQRLMAVEPWIANPVAENLRSLKIACVDPAAQGCKEKDCQDLDLKINTAEREITI